MPKFATEKFEGRQEVKVDRQPEFTKVVAQPVDTFIRPVESDYQRLSESLNKFTGGVANFLEKKQEEQDAVDVQQGRAGMLRGDAIPPEATEAYKRGHVSMFGEVRAGEIGAELRKQYEQNRSQAGFDPTTFAQNFIKEKTAGITSPDVQAAMNKHLSQEVAYVQADFEKYQMKQIREDEQKLVTQRLTTIFDKPGSPTEMRQRYDELVEQLKSENKVDMTRTDAGSLFGSMLLARAYEGDPEIIKVAREKGKDGFSLEMTNPELFTKIAHAQETAVKMYDRKQLQENDKVNAEEAGGWEKKINDDPLSFGDPTQFFMSRWSKYGNINSTHTFLHWVNRVFTAQEAAAKAKGHMWDVEANPHLAGLYWQDEKFKKQFVEERFVPIWQGVNEKDAGSVIEGIRRSVDVMKKYQGSEDPYVKGFFNRSLMSLNIDPKTKIERAPEQFVAAAQAYRYMVDNGMSGHVNAMFDDKAGLALRYFSTLTSDGKMDSAQAFQTILTAIRPENERRSFTPDERLKMKTDVTGFLKPWLGANYDMNGEEVTNRALILADTLYRGTNMEPKEIREYVISKFKDNLIDVGSGKVLYAPQGNVEGLPSPAVFKVGANRLIEDYQKEHPQAGDLTLTPYADGKHFGVVNKMRQVLEVVSIDDVKKGYEKAKYATGDPITDADAASRVRALLARKGKDTSYFDLAEVSGVVNRLYANKTLTTKERTEFENLRSQVRTQDQKRAEDFTRQMTSMTSTFMQGNRNYTGNDFATDIANPGGKNMRTIDYALEAAKSGDIQSSFTLLGEGLMTKRYKDPNGKDFNIGAGFNMTAHGQEGTYKALRAIGVSEENLSAVWNGSMEITPNQVIRLHKWTVKNEVEPMVKKVFGAGYDTLPPNVKTVLVDLGYAAGTKVGDFKIALEHIRKGDFEEAGKHLNLTYHKEGVGRVQDTRRSNMYRKLLAGDASWISYLNEVEKRTKK